MIFGRWRVGIFFGIFFGGGGSLLQLLVLHATLLRIMMLIAAVAVAIPVAVMMLVCPRGVTTVVPPRPSSIRTAVVSVLVTTGVSIMVSLVRTV